MSQEKEKLSFLVCGSQKFDDKIAVFSILNQLYDQTNGNLKRLVTSKFSGACQFAEEWAVNKNEELSKAWKLENPNTQLPEEDRIQIDHYLFDKHLLEKNASLFEEEQIPDWVLKQDPYFTKGKEMVMSENVKLVIAFPNKDGDKLGAATKNIFRFAKLANIPTLNVAEWYAKIMEKRNEVLNQETTNQENSSTSQPTTLQNRHPAKKF